MNLSAFTQVSHCKLPCLAIAVSLRHERQATRSSSVVDVSGIVAFVSGLLLDNDTNVRNWFSLCIRNGLKVSTLVVCLIEFPFLLVSEGLAVIHWLRQWILLGWTTLGSSSPAVTDMGHSCEFFLFQQHIAN